MINLFRAEWLKISGNRIPTAVFVWIYPISAFLLLMFAGIAAVVSEQFRQNIVNTPPLWTEQLLFPWVIINTEISRLVLVCFAADVFGGEYQRMMWKNLLPRRARIQVILNKYFTMSVFVLVAFLLMCAIVGVMVGVVAAIAGAPYGPSFAELGSEGLAEFLRRFGTQAVIAFAAAVLAASYAALGGIFTRSILGAVAVGVLLTLAEQGIVVVFAILSSLTQTPEILQGYLLTPGYNLANLSSWAQFGTAYTPPYMLQYGFEMFSPITSTLIVLGWLIGLISLTVYLFQRQDITT